MGLEQVELVMDAEDEFDNKIDRADDYGQSVNTVGAFYYLVLRLVRADPETGKGTFLIVGFVRI